ncbi:MAG: hypothetical protein RL154_971 [Pseudomonadota bacterium]|jgi:glycosyltransferase involved in cell wall biosynthesis
MKNEFLIDSVALLSPLAGIGRYNAEIAKLLPQFDVNANYKYYYGFVSDKVILPSSETRSLSTLGLAKKIIINNRVAKKLTRAGLRVYNSLTMPIYDLYWQPNFIPRDDIKTKKIITTVHDFSWHIEPSWHPKERADDMQKRFWDGIKRTDRIITGSEFTKQEIIKYLNYSADKIDVIYHGVDHSVFYPSNEITLDLPKKYILAVGSIEPRKNLINLLKAYDTFDAEFKNEYKLILVGFKGWNNSDIMSIIEKNKTNIIYLGYINDNELREVYSRASVFVYPSLYEGFGIPPLEAMACGTAVVVSNVSSLPEACGDSALYINPLCIDEIIAAIKSILENSALQNEYKQKGIKWAANFTWQESTKKHIESFYKTL